jgi:hypothetical protein
VKIFVRAHLSPAGRVAVTGAMRLLPALLPLAALACGSSPETVVYVVQTAGQAGASGVSGGAAGSSGQPAAGAGGQVTTSAGTGGQANAGASDGGASAGADGSPPATFCNPGSQNACVCGDGTLGHQICALDGSAWGDCPCDDGNPVGGSGGSSGTGGAADGTNGAAGSGPAMTCVPGSTDTCECTNTGNTALGTCAPDGSGYICDCQSGGQGSGGSAAGSCPKTQPPTAISANDCSQLNGPSDMNSGDAESFCPPGCAAGPYVFVCDINGTTSETAAPSADCSVVRYGTSYFACCPTPHCEGASVPSECPKGMTAQICYFGSTPAPGSTCEKAGAANGYQAWCCK